MAARPDRFLWLLGVVALAACAAYPAALLWGTTLEQVRALDGIAAEHEHWHIRQVSSMELQWLKNGLTLVAFGLSITAVALGRTQAKREAAVACWHELRSTATETKLRWRRLPRRVRWATLIGLGLLTTLRTYFSITKPVHPEEIASYEYFVRHGLIAVSAYYPIPNNHVLSNAISWWFYRVEASFWWSMRLPVLLISTAGTAGIFAGLLRRAPFLVALLATAAFSCLQLSLYNASAGRGYWLLITLAALVFYSTLGLSRPGNTARLAWVGLVFGCLAGGYTVPSFAYAAASAFTFLGLQAARRRNWPLLAKAGALGSVVAAGVLLLYSPVLLVSGSKVFFGNGFVAAQATGAFWRGLPAYLWLNEGMLVGQRSIGAVAVVLVLLATGWWWLRTQRVAPTELLPTTKAGYGGQTKKIARQRLLVGAALWFTFFPYACLTVQRVFPPERVLLYKSLFFFVVAGVLTNWWLKSSATPTARRWLRLALGAGFMLYASYEAHYVEYLNRHNRLTVDAYYAGYVWLRAQPPGAVLAPEPLHDLYFRYWAHAAAPTTTWKSDMTQNPARHYAYVVAFPNQRGAFRPVFAYPPAFANAEVEIFVAKPTVTPRK